MSTTDLMQAIRFHRHGGPEVLALESIPLPVRRAGESLIRVTCAGVNFKDVYQRTGLEPTSLPFVPGIEGAGVIVESDTWAAGTRVAWAMHGGAYAQYASVPDARLVPLPPAIDDATAAAALLQGLTAHYLTETTFATSAGQFALVHAGAGGVGLLLIQRLKQRGAIVLATVSTPGKAELARAAGADFVVLYTDGDFAAPVLAATNGQGVHVVYDSVGRATFAGSLSVLRPCGTLVLFGHSSGPVEPFDPMLLSRGSLFLTRPSLAHHIADTATLRARAEALFGWIADGTLTLRVDRGYTLADAARAHADLEARRTAGKLLLAVS